MPLHGDYSGALSLPRFSVCRGQAHSSSKPEVPDGSLPCLAACLGRVVGPPPHSEQRETENRVGTGGGDGRRQLVDRGAGFGDVPGKGTLWPSENQRGRVTGGLGSVESRLTRSGGTGRVHQGGPTEAGGDSCAGDGWPREGEVGGAEHDSP